MWKTQKLSCCTLHIAGQLHLLSLSGYHHPWLQVFHSPPDFGQKEHCGLVWYAWRSFNGTFWRTYPRVRLSLVLLLVLQWSGMQFNQLFNLYISHFLSSYKVISWNLLCEHDRDYVWDSMCRSEVNGAEIWDLFVPVYKCQADDMEDILLGCSLRPSFPNLGNGNHHNKMVFIWKVSRIQNYPPPGWGCSLMVDRLCSIPKTLTYAKH